MMSEGSPDFLLDENFLMKLEKLRIMAKKSLKGVSAGGHVSWHSGVSLEFLDYRKYQIGDDLRYVDWNVYGRLDKLFVKLFHAEKDLTLNFLLDCSGSMGFGSPAKEIYAKKLTAALSYVGLANLDRVGITAFGSTLGASMPPERGRQVYTKILRFLGKAAPEGETRINACLSAYAAGNRQAGVAVVISDLQDPEGIEKGLERLQPICTDIVLIQVLDRSEILPGDFGYLQMRDVETGKVKTISVNAAGAERYQKKMRRFLDNIVDYCTKNGIDYFLADTSIPFEDLLLEYLSRGRLFK